MVTKDPYLGFLSQFGALFRSPDLTARNMPTLYLYNGLSFARYCFDVVKEVRSRPSMPLSAPFFSCRAMVAHPPIPRPTTQTDSDLKFCKGVGAPLMSFGSPPPPRTLTTVTLKAACIRCLISVIARWVISIPIHLRCSLSAASMAVPHPLRTGPMSRCRPGSELAEIMRSKRRTGLRCSGALNSLLRFRIDGRSRSDARRPAWVSL